jgi:hypothetical protein
MSRYEEYTNVIGVYPSGPDIIEGSCKCESTLQFKYSGDGDGFECDLYVAYCKNCGKRHEMEI